MQFTILATLLAATASIAVAGPTKIYGPAPPSLPPYGGDSSGDIHCSNDRKAACCNGDNDASSETGDRKGGLGLGVLTGALDGVLGGSCSLSVVGGQCSQGSIACCKTSPQTGLINVGSVCLPISL